jgi:hypothetical protein
MSSSQLKMSSFQFNGMPPDDFCHAAQNARDMAAHLKTINDKKQGLDMEAAMTICDYTWRDPNKMVKCKQCGRTIPEVKAWQIFDHYYCGKLGHYNPRNPNDKEFTTQ